MGNEHHGIARGVELLEHGEHFPAGVRIQCAGGLVSQNHRRIARQGPGNGYPLLLAAGELGRLVAELIAKAHHFQCNLGPFMAFGAGHSRIHQRHFHIFQQRELGQEVILLKDEAQHFVADLRQLVLVHLSHILSVQQIGAGSGDIQASDDIHTGGLAGTGLAHNGHKLALLNLKRDVIGRLDGGIPHLIELAYVAEFNEGSHYMPPRPPGPPLMPPLGMPPLMPPGIMVMAMPISPPEEVGR